MSYRNKTYVAFASEDIHRYRLMTAWCENDKFDFDFHDAHDINEALDTSLPETIRRRLRERLANTKQAIVLGSAKCKSKASKSRSFIYYEIETIVKLEIPVVIANLDGDRTVDRNFIPKRFLDDDYLSLSVSFQPKIIQHALDHWVPSWSDSNSTGPHYYKAKVYTDLGMDS
jgi:hypothetical protein